MTRLLATALIVALACLVASAPLGQAQERKREQPPTELWEQYPLDETTPEAPAPQDEQSTPPARRDADGGASGRDEASSEGGGIGAGVLVAGALVLAALLALLLVLPALRRRRASSSGSGAAAKPRAAQAAGVGAGAAAVATDKPGKSGRGGKAADRKRGERAGEKPAPATAPEHTTPAASSEPVPAPASAPVPVEASSPARANGSEGPPPDLPKAVPPSEPGPQPGAEDSPPAREEKPDSDYATSDSAPEDAVETPQTQPETPFVPASPEPAVADASKSDGDGSAGSTRRELALGYTTVLETDEANSPRLREEARRIQAACRDRDLVLSKLVRDLESHSGPDLERPGLTYALDRLAEGEFNCLVVTRLDRLTRSAANLGTLIRMLSERDARLVVIDIELDTRTREGRLAAETLTTVGGLERKKLEQRTRKGLEAARSNRRSSGRPAVADRPSLKQRISDMRAAGMTLQAIADTLNDEGVPTVRGGAEWRPSSVQAAAGYKRPNRRGGPRSRENNSGS